MDSVAKFLNALLFVFVVSSPCIFSMAELDPMRQVEMDALLYLKNQLGDHPAFSDWVKSDTRTVCQAQWSFLGCEGGKVTSLLFNNAELAAKNPNWKKGESPGPLSGKFPWNAAVLLRALKVIILTGNDFSGPVLPDEIGSLLHLEELRLNRNNFTGTLPNQLTSLVNLTVLDASENGITGDIPYGVYKLTKLQVLNLSFNKFNSYIPLSVGFIHSLERLNLANNKFLGEIPDLDPLYNLVFLELQNNELQGSLPQSAKNATNLFYIDVSSNGIQGAIPPDFITLTSLHTLLLQNNALSGSIPDSLFTSPSLAVADFSNNYFNNTAVPSNNISKLNLQGNCFPDQKNQRQAQDCREYYTVVPEFQ